MIVNSDSVVRPAITAPIRVLHLIDSPNRRGAELFALDLAASLPAKAFESVVVSLYVPEDGTPLESPLLHRMDGHRGRLEKAFGVNWWLLGRVVREVRRHSTDVVISHGGATLRYGAVLRFMMPGTRLITGVSVHRPTGLRPGCAHAL